MPSDATHSIVIANDLQTGRSVFFTSESSWSETVEQAELIAAGPDAEIRLQAALNDEKSNLVIDPYLVSVDADRQIRDTREHIRTIGPTIFSDALVVEALAAETLPGKSAARQLSYVPVRSIRSKNC